MTTTKYGDSGISPRTNVYAARDMLRHAQPVIVLEKLAKVYQIPKNKTQTIKFRRPNTFTAATTPLTEGITPTATQFSYTDVEATIKQYGQVVEITDHIADTHEDPVLMNATEISGENIGRTKEALDWAVVRAGTNVIYANGTARNQVNTPVSLAKQRKATRFLKDQKATKITKVLDGSINFATRAVEASFVAVAHSDLEADVRALPGFIPEASYGSKKKICEEEIGSVDDVRYVLSSDLDSFADAGGAFAGSGTSMVSTSGTSADIYPIIYMGKDAWGTVALRGKHAISPTIIPVESRSKSDPLGQVGYVGWKTWHVALILNDAWMTRLEVAATEL